ncbi:MAG: hypothetical protein P1U88_00010 [Thalassobaculaceae bacterium]|nr:hypothetical protein [Thalassobaculaceae bacterium]
MDAIVGILTLGALAVFFNGPWQWVCTDVARQLMFERRDAVFDMAREGKLRFDSPEYRDIRQSIEQLIRYAHDLTLARFLYLAFARGLIHKSTPSNFRDAVDRIENAEVRREVHNHLKMTMIVVLVMMVAKSPFLTLLLCAGPLFLGLKAQARRAARIIQIEAEEADDVRGRFAPIN